MSSTVTIAGNLTRDPELRFTGTGTPHVTLGVAVNRRWQNRHTNEWEESTSFFDVIAWATLAENVAQCLKRGDRVVIDGRLDQRRWENGEGDKRSSVQIYASEIAASVRFATVEINKATSGSLQTVPAGPADDDAGGDDEEPF